MGTVVYASCDARFRGLIHLLEMSKWVGLSVVGPGYGQADQTSHYVAAHTFEKFCNNSKFCVLHLVSCAVVLEF